MVRGPRRPRLPSLSFRSWTEAHIRRHPLGTERPPLALIYGPIPEMCPVRMVRGPFQCSLYLAQPFLISGDGNDRPRRLSSQDV